MRLTLFFLIALMPILVCSQSVSLTGKVICLDAGHGGTQQTDSYRVGPTGEREEWVNLRVALLLQKLLESRGAQVIMTRTDDSFIPLTQRSEVALANKADIFVSIHHNATADTSVNFPIIYFHGNSSENISSVALGKQVGMALREALFTAETPVSLVSDHTVFAGVGASVLRNTYGIPAVLVEASFFTNPTEEQRLKSVAYNKREAEAYLTGIERFFTTKHKAISPKNSMVPIITPFKVFQESERMRPEARLWREYFEKGEELLKYENTDSLSLAYDLFTQSARYFPDSFVAGLCHKKRAELLKKSGRLSEATEENLRHSQYYIDM